LELDRDQRVQDLLLSAVETSA
ncbi:MAG: hypothetical protein JWO46_2208, partial [Nocardioidaceae bacterium]|nr:hypothetical protein [Nocardioidaceae bacterium]